MNNAFPLAPALLGYAIAAVIFAALSIWLLRMWRGGVRAAVLLLALTLSGLWATAMAGGVYFASPQLWLIGRILDGLRLGSWLVFLALLVTPQLSAGGRLPRGTSRRAMFIATALLVAGIALPPLAPPWLAQLAEPASMPAFYAGLGIAIVGLAMLERLYRQTPANQWWTIKPLVIGLAGLFAFDLVLYSGAILFREMDVETWAIRGFAHGLTALLVALATARNRAWTMQLHVSREAVFQSTALLLAGVYLVIVALAGYWVEHAGGGWGGTLKIAMGFAAFLGLAVLALSGKVRSRLKVFIGKHLYAYRYEYRTEWLRFTRMLGTTEPGENIYQQVVRALADLVESTGGTLWLERNNSYVQVAELGFDDVQQAEPSDAALCCFLRERAWVVDLDEYARAPQNYHGLILPNWLLPMHAWLVVPLAIDVDLLGFVVLAHPRTPIDVNWEVRDILKTASRQVAGFLAQTRARQALVEAEQFAAFNRMSAFVVHDLKNLIAQLALLLKNAERHRHNPEFQADMLETVQHAVDRMNRMMLQLRTGTTPTDTPGVVDLSRIVQRVVLGKGTAAARIEVVLAADARVLAHEERIERVIGHIVQNALEASRDGAVAVKVHAGEKSGVVEVVDSGVGMTPRFVQERLFHPFQTTKAQGMGIGMYESYQYVNAIGGRIVVDSAPDSGSRFQLFLPAAGARTGTAPAEQAS